VGLWVPEVPRRGFGNFGLTLPATALRCVHRVITELGVFDPAGDHFACVEKAPGVDEDRIRQGTAAPVVFARV
jgi:acyl CoA:acetate/3-ketoacid CoA transferase beta subunit